MPPRHYKVAKCRCPLCRSFHQDIVDVKQHANQYGWIPQVCDRHLEIKIGKPAYQRYLRWKNAILEKIRTQLPPDLPVDT